MHNKISRNYQLSVNGLLTVEDEHIYISIEDGPQDVDLVQLMEDFNGKEVQLMCNFTDEYDVLRK